VRKNVERGGMERRGGLGGAERQEYRGGDMGEAVVDAPGTVRKTNGARRAARRAGAMDLDARASARRAEPHPNGACEAATRAGAKCELRGTRPMSRRAREIRSSGPKLGRRRAGQKREYKWRLQERGEPDALGVECDAFAASAMVGEVGEAEVDWLRRGRVKVGARGMPARRTLRRCARGARCPPYTHASPGPASRGAGAALPDRDVGAGAGGQVGAGGINAARGLHSICS
jgi:hypothetical protein